MSSSSRTKNEIHCLHCGTVCVAQNRTQLINGEQSTKSTPAENGAFCCEGCRFVYRLIRESELDFFYHLKGTSVSSPILDRAFEPQDFSWIADRVLQLENELVSHAKPRLRLGISGISCIGCVWLIEKIFSQQGGALRLDVQSSLQEIEISWENGEFSGIEFAKKLQRFGYIAMPCAPNEAPKISHELKMRLGLCSAFAMNAMIFSLPRYFGLKNQASLTQLFDLVVVISATLSLFVGGAYFFKRAWRSAQARVVHMDFPISLGILLAYGGSIFGWVSGHAGLLYFDFVAIFVAFMLFGRLLQQAILAKTQQKLIAQTTLPESVEIFQPGKSEKKSRIATSQIAQGMTFELRPGQVVPVAGSLAFCDGQNAEFSLEWITGEPNPISLGVGSDLLAGAKNLSAIPIRVFAKEPWQDSFLKQLVEGKSNSSFAQNSAEKKNPKLERLLKIYIVSVLLVGIISSIYWFLTTYDLEKSLQIAISIFVVSCPCALGISLPLAEHLAALNLEKFGVFSQSSTLWARLSQIKAIFFDKTGTLTLGSPKLLNTNALDALSETELADLQHLTAESRHPICRALRQALAEKLAFSQQNPTISPPSEVSGLGIFWQEIANAGHARKSFSLGKPGWIFDSPVEAMPEKTQHDPLLHDFSAGIVQAEFRCEGELRATFAFKETLRPGVENSLTQLGNAGFEFGILSGDRQQNISQIAADLNLRGIPIRLALGELSPNEKSEKISSQKTHAKNILYIGDGANDAFAFDSAGLTGTPVIERSVLSKRADFFFVGQSLNFLPAFFLISKKYHLAIKCAFFASLFYNFAAITAAVNGRITPLVAAVIMPINSFVSLLIISKLMRCNPK